MGIKNRESHRRAASDEVPMDDGTVSRLDRIILGGGWPGSFDNGAVRADVIVGPRYNAKLSTGPAVVAVLGTDP